MLNSQHRRLDSMYVYECRSDEFGDPSCRTCSAIVFNILVGDFPSNLISDSFCDHLWSCLLNVHAATCMIAIKPMPNMENLLEMVAQGETQARPLVRCQLHRRRQSTLHDCQVADGETRKRSRALRSHPRWEVTADQYADQPQYRSFRCRRSLTLLGSPPYL
jgi:hypothetical protein